MLASSGHARTGASSPVVCTRRLNLSSLGCGTEYPAKVTFEGAPKHVTLAKTQLKQFGGDFKTSDKKADVAIKMTGTATGKETLKAKAKFSVCNDTTCVIREASIDVAVNVTK